MADFYLPLVDEKTGERVSVKIDQKENEILKDLHAYVRMIEGISLVNKGKFNSIRTLDLLKWQEEYNSSDIKGNVYVMNQRGQAAWKLTLNQKGHVIGFYGYQPLTFFPENVFELNYLRVLKITLDHVDVEEWPPLPSSLEVLHVSNSKGSGTFDLSFGKLKKLNIAMQLKGVEIVSGYEWRRASFFLSDIFLDSIPNKLRSLAFNSCRIFPNKPSIYGGLDWVSMHNCFLGSSFVLAGPKIDINGRINFSVKTISHIFHEFFVHNDSWIA